MLRQVPFAVSSGSAFSKKNNDSNLINMYVHIEEKGSKSDHILLNSSGLELILTAPYKILGTYQFLGVTYVITTKRLYSITEGILKEIGEISLTDKVFIADNGTEMIFVARDGYYYNPTTDTLGSMNQPGWYHADTITYMDGYFIFNRTDTGQFFITKLYSHEIDPIDWATAESAPDDTVAVIVARRQLWILGEKSSEVWYDSGNPNFPFTRISGAVTDIGCANHKTVARVLSSVFFIGEDFKVYMTQGYTPTVVSTSAVEFFLSQSSVSTFKAFSYTEDGHWFYCITLSDNKTFVYDITTGLWHTRVSGELGKWKIEGALNLQATKRPIGFSGKDLYRISTDYLTENGTQIKREAVTLPLNKTVNRMIIHEAQLDMEVGFDNVNAKVGLRMSKDGGVTWGNINEAYTGDIGENRNRVNWKRLGQVRDCIFKIVITDPIPIRLIGFHIRAS